ncbi:MAG: sigma-70 family RNA polymerase sigma factor [Clostridiales bacterium]|jgi:RNA polymerase sigma factor (sigma-70 family)|nr:sigma-70 family RNA polymerase sigma factor [Clostridiales bacterium]
MPTVTYKFCDGTVREVEIGGELYAVHEQLLSDEKRNHWKETRRHVSLDYLNDSGIDFEDMGGDPLSVLIRREESAAYERIFAALSGEQRELLESVYIDGRTRTEIAEQKGVSQQAVSKHIATIIRKLKKSF